MALFNKNYLKSITLIEHQTQKNEFKPMATGFLIGFLVKDKSNSQNKKYRLFLITNRHVFENFSQLWIRFNRKNDKGTERFSIKLTEAGETKWLAHKDKGVDLAMLPVNHKKLDEKGVDWRFIRKENMVYPKKYGEIGIELGDGVFLPGFPMGLSGKIQNYTIVRSGTLARIDKEIIRREKSILIDAMVFPGNSGGPVFLKPEIISLDGTKPVNTSYLVGIVSGYKNYREKLFSHQTSPPSVGAISIENSGLASVVPISFAQDIFTDFIKSQKKLEKEVEDKEKLTAEQIKVSSK